MVAHFDTCLGCMACETACPSGVRYAPLVEETRAAIEHHHTRPLGDRVFRRLLFSLLPYPARLRLFALPLALVNSLRDRPGLLSLLPRKLRNLIELAPDARHARTRRRAGAHAPRMGAARLRVGFVTGCVQQVFFGHVNDATVRVLAAEGCDVVAPRAAGLLRRARAALRPRRGRAALRAQADRDVRAAADVDVIVVNAAGCGSSMKRYGELFRERPGVVGARAGVRREGARRHRGARGARRAAGATSSARHARRVSRRLPPRPRAGRPSAAARPAGGHSRRDARARSRKATSAAAARVSSTWCNRRWPRSSGDAKPPTSPTATPDIVATTNPGCMLQITAAARAAGDDRPIVHVVEILDASIRGERLPTLYDHRPVRPFPRRRCIAC